MNTADVLTTAIQPRQGKVKSILFGTTLEQRKARIGAIFVLPTMIFAVIIFLIPTLFSLALTFFGWDIIGGFGSFVGLDYYHAALNDPTFWTTMKNTLMLGVFSVPATVALAFLAALALQSSTRVYFRGTFRLIYFLPVITSHLAMAYVWQWLYNPSYGLFNSLLDKVGLQPQMWLTASSSVLPSLAVIYIWARFGFGMLIFIAGLEGIPTEYYQAAAIDGATRWQIIRHITIPLLNRQFVLVALLETIGALKVFDIVYASTQGGPGDASRTTVMYIYETAFELFQFGRASVAALALFAFILVLTIVQRQLLSRGHD